MTLRIRMQCPSLFMVHICQRSISSSRRLVWIRMGKIKSEKLSKRREDKKPCMSMKATDLNPSAAKSTESELCKAKADDNAIIDASILGKSKLPKNTPFQKVVDLSHQLSTSASSSGHFYSTNIACHSPQSQSIPGSSLQFQPRALYTTRPEVYKSERSEQKYKEMTYTERYQDQCGKSSTSADRWTTVYPKESSQHYSRGRLDYKTDRKPFKRKQKTGKDYKHDKKDPFGFSTLPRKWEYTEAGLKFEREYSAKYKSGLPFSVMSYNVLSQNLLEDHPYLYQNCSPEALDWDMRSERLLVELKHYKPDVICLQEVQLDHYESFFRKHLRKMGYGCEYIKRSGDKQDGCATFYNLDKFSLLKCTPVEYLKGGLLNRDNVALILELVPNTKLYHGSVEKLCIANTHLLYNPRRGDIKLGQLMVLMAELDACLHRASKKSEEKVGQDQHVRYHPVILCGDFNSGPSSDLYKFLTSGYLHYEGRLARHLSGQREGYYGQNYHLHRHFFRGSYGISDQCQYLSRLVERQEEISKRLVSTSAEQISVSELYRDDNKVMESDLQNSSQNLDASNTNANTASELQTNIQSSESQIDITTQCQSNTDQTASGSSDIVDASSCRSEVSSSETKLSQTPGDIIGALSCHSEIGPSQTSYTQASGKVWHKLNLISAYKHRIQRCSFREPEITTQHNGEGCTVDYILYSGSRCNRREGEPASKEGKLKLLARHGLMSSNEIYNMGSLPNHVHPSDHLSLVTKFLLR